MSQFEEKNGVNFVIWCYWEGKPMNANRLKSFELLRKNIGVPVQLVTPENLQEFILPDSPLHRAFPYLSLVHRSDYIRAYLLHHYGGGWHDVKATEVSFQSAWDEFKQSEIWLVGRRELPRGASPAKLETGESVSTYWKELVAVPAWVGRKQTPFSRDLLAGIDRELDKNFEKVKKHPAKHPREKYTKPTNVLHGSFLFIKKTLEGRNPYYPLEWTLFGNVFHPLNLKYKDNISRNLPVDRLKNAGVYHR
jgi:hypothetical protein